MADDVSEEARTEVVAAITKLWEDGCPVASQPEEMAPVAIRRWLSGGRRGLDPSDREDRIRDLIKGLISQFERDRHLVGALRSDYEHVARAIAGVLEKKFGG